MISGRLYVQLAAIYGTGICHDGFIYHFLILYLVCPFLFFFFLSLV